MQTIVQDYLNNLCCTEVITYNFDVTANWATGDSSYPVTDQASFEAFLSERSYEETNDLTSIVITDFQLIGNRLRCNLTASGTMLDISAMGVSEVLCVGNITGLLFLWLSENNISVFNPTQALPNTVELLALDNNQIVNFNPTLPLPSGLLQLELNVNLVVTFNPTLPLPSGLQRLYIPGNQIVTFNPSIALPNSLQVLDLEYNQMTTAGYTASEPWANGMHTAPSGGTIALSLNTNSASGTNLETILTAKGWTVGV
jgi:Leucine-rich repeat (LRR) protein